MANLMHTYAIRHCFLNEQAICTLRLVPTEMSSVKKIS